MLELADQVYRVARRLVSTPRGGRGSRPGDLRARFRSWRSYTPGTNLRAWLMRILTNLNIDRGRREQRAPDMQPMEEGDYFLYNRLEETPAPRTTSASSSASRRTRSSRRSRTSRTTSATRSSSSTSATSPTRRRRRSSTSPSGRSCRACTAAGGSSRASLPRPSAGRSRDQFDPICEKCEELIQPYLDRELSEAESSRPRGTSPAAATAASATASRSACAATCARPAATRRCRRS